MMEKELQSEKEVKGQAVMVEGDHEESSDQSENVMMKHAAFFDKNGDGIIYPCETFQGCREIGVNLASSLFAAVFINVGLSHSTLPPGMKPSIMFPIYVKNIHKGKHASDSGSYDTQGRFVPSKFEEIFQKHAKTRPDALTKQELNMMLRANREPHNFLGSLGGYTEWHLLYRLGKDNQGLLHKDTVRSIYDGSFFHKLSQDHKASSSKNTPAKEKPSGDNNLKTK